MGIKTRLVAQVTTKKNLIINVHAVQLRLNSNPLVTQTHNCNCSNPVRTELYMHYKTMMSIT